MSCCSAVPISTIPPVGQGVGPLVYANGNQMARLTPPLNPSFVVYDGSVTRWGDGSVNSPVLLPNLQQVTASSVGYFVGINAGGQLVKSPYSPLVTNGAGNDPTNLAGGVDALISNVSGVFNIAFGTSALQFNTSGFYNNAIGNSALAFNTIGTDNCAFGIDALGDNVNGSYNIAVGSSALYNIIDGSENVGIGANVDASSSSVSNEVTISNGTVFARFQGAASAWSFISDERDKSEIENLELGLDFITNLQPRKFKWAIRKSNVDQGKEAAGFIAQEVLSVVEESQAECLRLVDTNNPEQFTFASTNLIPVLVNAIKELKEEIETLKAVNGSRI